MFSMRMGMGLGAGRQKSGGSGETLTFTNTETEAYYNALSAASKATCTQDAIDIIDGLVTDLKAGGVFAKLDVLYLLNNWELAHTLTADSAAIVNLAAPADATIGKGTITGELYQRWGRGVQRNLTDDTATIDTNFVPAVGVSNLQANSISMFAGRLSVSTGYSNGKYTFYNGGAANAEKLGVSWNYSTAAVMSFAYASGYKTSTGLADWGYTGLFGMIKRLADNTGNTDVKVVRDTYDEVTLGTTRTNAGLPETPMTIKVIVGSEELPLSIAGIGSELSRAEWLALYAAYDRYNTAMADYAVFGKAAAFDCVERLQWQYNDDAHADGIVASYTVGEDYHNAPPDPRRGVPLGVSFNEDGEVVLALARNTTEAIGIMKRSNVRSHPYTDEMLAHEALYDNDADEVTNWSPTDPDSIVAWESYEISYDKVISLGTLIQNLQGVWYDKSSGYYWCLGTVVGGSSQDIADRLMIVVSEGELDTETGEYAAVLVKSIPMTGYYFRAGHLAGLHNRIYVKSEGNFKDSEGNDLSGPLTVLILDKAKTLATGAPSEAAGIVRIEGTGEGIGVDPVSGEAWLGGSSREILRKADPYTWASTEVATPVQPYGVHEEGKAVDPVDGTLWMACDGHTHGSVITPPVDLIQNGNIVTQYDVSDTYGKFVRFPEMIPWEAGTLGAGLSVDANGRLTGTGVWTSPVMDFGAHEAHLTNAVTETKDGKTLAYKYYHSDSKPATTENAEMPVTYYDGWGVIEPDETATRANITGRYVQIEVTIS